ncbi:MAG: glycosyltransferase family 61 protein, partial [Selenomonadaceae bacterium]|nr:glycosyltransferase family 61 protein [Selenomonadaceae bacterium]
IYLSRSKLPPGAIGKGRGFLYQFNEQYFEKFFASKGYQVIFPETLSVAEQVSLISNADEIASSLGTLSHWALFCRPGTKFTMLTRTDSIDAWAQFMINAMRKINWYFVDVSINFLHQHHFLEPCLMGETKYWKQYVKQMYDEDVESETWREHVPAYVDYYCQLHNIKNSAPQFIQLIDRAYELLTKKILIDSTVARR